MNCLSKSFPPSIIAHDRIVLCRSFAQNSLSNYAGGLFCFTRFCNNFSVPESTRMPVTESLLCLFITSHGAGRVGRGTLTNWITGIELWHSIMVCLG